MASPGSARPLGAGPAQPSCRLGKVVSKRLGKLLASTTISPNFGPAARRRADVAGDLVVEVLAHVTQRDGHAGRRGRHPADDVVRRRPAGCGIFSVVRIAQRLVEAVVVPPLEEIVAAGGLNGWHSQPLVHHPVAVIAVKAFSYSTPLASVNSRLSTHQPGLEHGEVRLVVQP